MSTDAEHDSVISATDLARLAKAREAANAHIRGKRQEAEKSSTETGKGGRSQTP